MADLKTETPSFVSLTKIAVTYIIYKRQKHSNQLLKKHSIDVLEMSTTAYDNQPDVCHVYIMSHVYIMDIYSVYVSFLIYRVLTRVNRES